MTEAIKKGKKIKRTRKRVYETVEPANIPEMSPEAVENLIEEPNLTALDAGGETVEHPAKLIVEPDGGKGAKALSTVRRYSLLSAGLGIVPLPLVDMMTMMALQMLMVRKLAMLYDIPYAKQYSKAAVAGLIAGFNAGYLGGSALKMIPILGTIIFSAMPTINAAISYAVGKVFIQHFESGGTFLDFDPQKVRAYFEDQFRKGKLKAL